MNFNEYQDKALEFASYPNKGMNTLYPALGLSGEAGEAADKVKKWWRNQGATCSQSYTDDQCKELAKEIGDVLWYVSGMAFELGYTLEDIAQMNVEKLTDRVKRGVVKSEGDNR